MTFCNEKQKRESEVEGVGREVWLDMVEGRVPVRQDGRERRVVALGALKLERTGIGIEYRKADKIMVIDSNDASVHIHIKACDCIFP